MKSTVALRALGVLVAYAAAAEAGAAKPAAAAPAGQKEELKPIEQKAEKAAGPTRAKFTPEQITEIRKLRAEKDEEGKPVWSHAKLAAKFGTGAGTISQIVRNRTYKDENYKPVNDGK